MIKIYTDGGAKPNPGKAGYGIIIESDKYIKVQQGFEESTNNRMELLAVVEALEMTSGDEVEVYSDSRYVTGAMNEGWLSNWEKNRWMRKGQIIPNVDLWKRLVRAMRCRNVSFIWVRGHNGHKQNEECDRMATEARLGDNLCIDQEFLNQIL